MRRNPAAADPTANSFECPGCGDEIDPRAFSREGATQRGYCSLICFMENGGEAA